MVFIKDGNGGVKVSLWNLITLISLTVIMIWSVATIKTGVEEKIVNVEIKVAVLDAKFTQFLIQRAVIDERRDNDLKQLSEMLTEVRIEVKTLK